MTGAKSLLAGSLARSAIEVTRLAVVDRPNALIEAAIFEDDGRRRDRLVGRQRDLVAELAVPLAHLTKQRSDVMSAAG